MNIPQLTEGEAKVYTALIELGESSIGSILKVSGVSHSKIYDILKRLAEKGLVSAINKNGRQYFTPAEPTALGKLITDERRKLDDEENQLKTIIRELDVRKKKTHARSLLSAYEGIKGMKNVLDEVINELDAKDTVLVLGTPRQITEQAGGYLKEWQQRRMQRGAVCKIISDVDAPSWKDRWWIDSKKKKVTFTKRSTSISPAYFVITKKSVTTIYFAGNILSFRVEHPQIAERYTAFFEEVWKTAK